LKRAHEIWEDDSGSAMFLSGAKGWRESLSPHAKLTKTFEAESRFEAFRTYYSLMGGREWKTPEGVTDLRYTGDDSHDFSQERN
jgi:hypothetical protein